MAWRGVRSTRQPEFLFMSPQSNSLCRMHRVTTSSIGATSCLYTAFLSASLLCHPCYISYTCKFHLLAVVLEQNAAEYSRKQKDCICELNGHTCYLSDKVVNMMLKCDLSIVKSTNMISEHYLLFTAYPHFQEILKYIVFENTAYFTIFK